MGVCVGVCVQVDLAVQVKHLSLQSLGESPQSSTATLAGRQLRSDTQTTGSSQQVCPQGHMIKTAPRGLSVRLQLCGLSEHLVSGMRSHIQASVTRVRRSHA